ncbi:MAG: hypothetical protein ACLQU4_10180 [Limisphaerales bacterium]
MAQGKAKICLYFHSGQCFNGRHRTKRCGPKAPDDPRHGFNRVYLTVAKRLTTGKNMKAKKPTPPPLAKGQLWRMDDKHIEIMEVGKTLTHYRLFQSQKRVPISLGGIAAVQAYLKSNGAKLIRKASPLKTA